MVLRSKIAFFVFFALLGCCVRLASLDENFQNYGRIPLSWRVKQLWIVVRLCVRFVEDWPRYRTILDRHDFFDTIITSGSEKSFYICSTKFLVDCLKNMDCIFMLLTLLESWGLVCICNTGPGWVLHELKRKKNIHHM